MVHWEVIAGLPLELWVMVHMGLVVWAVVLGVVEGGPSKLFGHFDRLLISARSHLNICGLVLIVVSALLDIAVVVGCT